MISENGSELKDQKIGDMHLVIYQIKGEGEYYTEEENLHFFLQIPAASLQIPVNGSAILHELKVVQRHRMAA